MMPEEIQKRWVNLLSILGFLGLIGIGFLKERLDQHKSGTKSPTTTLGAQATPFKTTAAVTLHPGAEALVAQFDPAHQTPEQELQALEQVIDLYRRAHGENPEGDNADVVQALLGQNRHHTAFLPADVPFIQQGQLVDRWGTPYFLHPESGHLMTLRSAGPDKTLFTPDDVTLE